jgi:PUA domain protein
VYSLKAKERSRLRNHETKEVLRQLSETLNIDTSNLVAEKLEVAKFRPNIKIFMVRDVPAFVSFEDKLFPTMTFEPLLKKLPSLIVDMGAVPHVCNGSNVMAPGIVRVEGAFEKGAIAVVRDEKHLKPIAVVKTLSGSLEMETIKRGKVAENLHYVGDEVWRIMKLV